MTSEQSPLAVNENDLHQHKGLFLFSGILAVIVGVVAIILPQIATFATNIFIGAILVAGGIVAAVTAFRARGSAVTASGIIVGLLAIAAGVILLVFPLVGVVSLTLFLAAYFLVTGILKLFYAFKIDSERSRIWAILGGGVSVVLAIVLFAALPEAAFWALGLIVGIDFIIYGFTLIEAACSAGSQRAASDG